MLICWKSEGNLFFGKLLFSRSLAFINSFTFFKSVHVIFNCFSLLFSLFFTRFSSDNLFLFYFLLPISLKYVTIFDGYFLKFPSKFLFNILIFLWQKISFNFLTFLNYFFYSLWKFFINYKFFVLINYRFFSN